MKLVFSLLVLTFFLSLVFVAHAEEISSEDFVMYSYVTGSSGGNVSGTNFSTEFTAGQPTVGISNDSEYTVYWGFWAPNETGNVSAAIPPPPSQPPPPPPGGGGGVVYECHNNADCDTGQYCLNHKCYVAECFEDSDCEEYEMCYEYHCVVLFDIIILDFESPVKLGDFFDFTYLVKGVGFINDDVVLNYWIEGENGTITSGSDTIYMEGFIERIETSKLFLPTTAVSGVYEFYTEVVYKSYRAISHRTIEIYVDEGTAQIIIPGEEGFDLMQIIIILMLILAIILSLLAIVLWKKRRFGLKRIDEKTTSVKMTGKIESIPAKRDASRIKSIPPNHADKQISHKDARKRTIDAESSSDVLRRIKKRVKRIEETPAEFLKRIRKKIRGG